jgi:hypothetical protein
MNELDLKARHCISKDQYKQYYKDSIIDFSNNESKKLIILTNSADKLLYKYPKLYNIPWNFSKLTNNIENSFPHTLGNNIFISSIPSLETLIHEKIHIYQRTYPIETTILLNNWGFVIKNKQENVNNSRNNPDINSFIYGKDDYYLIQLYNNNMPNSIQDSSTYLINSNKVQITAKDIGFPSSIKQVEHPYEIMACIISQIICNTICDDNIDKTNITINWMDQYL